MTKARDVATQGGLVLITRTNFSAASTVNFDNIFTSTYDNYKFAISINSGSATTNFVCGMRSNGTNLVSASYRYGLYYVGAYNGVAFGTGNAINNDVVDLGVHDATVGYGAEINVFKPFLNQYTQITSTESGSNLVVTGATINNTNSYDGIRFFPTSGNITGTIRVYGIRN